MLNRQCIQSRPLLQKTVKMLKEELSSNNSNNNDANTFFFKRILCFKYRIFFLGFENQITKKVIFADKIALHGGASKMSLKQFEIS